MTIWCLIYVRISLASLGDTTKTDEQERLGRERCAQRGWEVAGVYCDNSKSAWQRNRKRPDWDRLLADVAAGKGDVIYCYWGDRLVRQNRDLEDLIDLGRERGILLASAGGDYDLANPDHQMMLRWQTARACNESDTISRRKKAAFEVMRREGKVRPGGRGGRAFAFAKDNLTVVPAEAAIVREAAERVLAGEGTGAICADLTSRGIVTVTGIPFAHGTLRKLLARPRYAGLMPDGKQPAAWPAILERSQWEAVRAVLDDRAGQFAYATNARRYLLSGLAECGSCGSLLAIRMSRGRAGHAPVTGYGCVTPGCRKVYRSQPLLDEYVIVRTVLRATQDANPVPQMAGAPGLAERFAALDAQRAEIEEVLADPSRGSIPALLKRLDKVNAGLAELRDLAAGDARARIRAARAGITGAEFAGMPLAEQRALVSAHFGVIVLAASKKGPGFRTEDVLLIPLG